MAAASLAAPYDSGRFMSLQILSIRMTCLCLLNMRLLALQLGALGGLVIVQRLQHVEHAALAPWNMLLSILTPSGPDIAVLTVHAGAVALQQPRTVERAAGVAARRRNRLRLG